jgi:hypothetical protein
MSSTQNEDAREGYQKLVNVKQGGDPSQQRVVVYVPDTRRKRSPEAEARAQARAEIKEAYKAAALAEELKMVKKQRNRLVDNLSKTGKTPSIAVVDIPETLSGTPKTFVQDQSSPSPSQVSAAPVVAEKVSTSSVPAGPVGPTGTPVFNEKRNYSAPIGPVGPSGTPVFDEKRNYTSPIGPVGPSGTPVFNNRRNYSAPIGPMPMPQQSPRMNMMPFSQQPSMNMMPMPQQSPRMNMMQMPQQSPSMNMMPMSQMPQQYRQPPG